MPNTPATLTQYILHLLEKEENSDKFNTFEDNIVAFIAGNKTLQFYFHYDDESYTSSNFHFLHPDEQKKIIRIALLSLDEFNSLRNNYDSMLYDKSIEEIDEIFKEENIII